MTQPWNMARVRSRQLPRRYRPVGAVGEPRDAVDTWKASWRNGEFDTFERACIAPDNELQCCMECGYHVCSCARKYNFPVVPCIENGQTAGLPDSAFCLAPKLDIVVSENVPPGSLYLFDKSGLHKVGVGP